MNREIWSRFVNLTAPEGTGGGSGDSSASDDDSTARDLAELSAEGDEEETGDGADDDSGDAEETGDEEEEEIEASGEEEDKEEEDEEEKPEKKEDVREDGRPSIRDIKTKYPNLFKDFPSLRAAFFEYPKYLEVFPDVDSARSASSKAEEFDALENSLVNQGDPRLLLKVLSENNPKSFKRIATELADAVRETDPGAYAEFVNPVVEDLLHHALQYGVKIGDKNLQLAARHIANFVWANGGDVPDASGKRGKKEPSEAERQLHIERQQHATEKYNEALQTAVASIATEFDQILGSKLEGLTPFERKQVIKESKDEVDRLLLKDGSFQATMKGLWKRAAESGYSAESKSRIKRAWLDRARLIAPRVKARIKQEALDGRKGGGGKKDESDTSSGKVTLKRNFPASGASGKGGGSTGQRSVLDPKKIDWRRTSDLDILNSK